MEKVHILNVVKNFKVGGIQKYLIDFLRFFKANNKYEFHVVSLEKKKDSIFSKIIDEEKLNVSYLDCVPHKGRYNFIRVFRDQFEYNRKLSKFLKHNNFDVIISHNTRIFNEVGKTLIKFRRRMPVFHFLQSNPNAIDERTAATAKMVFSHGIVPVCTNNTQFLLAKNRYGINDCEYLNTPVTFASVVLSDHKNKDILNKFGCKNNDYIVCSVGRCDKIKNLSFLLDVFSKALSLNNTAYLIIAGDGAETDSLIEKSKLLGINNRVCFAGYLKDVQEVYSIADCFVSTSISEASSLVTIEAQLNNIPCVLSKGVPIESVFNNNVVRLDLNDNIDRWAKNIIEPTDFIKPISKKEDFLIENISDRLVKIISKYQE